MPLAITAPVQLSATQNTTPVRINTGGDVATLQPQVESASSTVTITPAPVIQVNASTESNASTLESPFIDITQQAADDNNLTKQSLPSAATIDKTPQQLQALNQQQQQIDVRQSELAEQEEAIEREISQLQQKEIEINRKKFQLQQSTGNLLNIQV